MRAPRARPSESKEAPVPGGPSNKTRNLVGFMISQKSSKSTGELRRMKATMGAESSAVVATFNKGNYCGNLEQGKLSLSLDQFSHLDVRRLGVPWNFLGEEVVLSPL